jgi:predicted NUDIX family NTP pyrophosphohydrolase
LFDLRVAVAVRRFFFGRTARQVNGPEPEVPLQGRVPPPYHEPMKQSAGLLLYRPAPGGLEVLLVHPSGPYNRKAPWGIPKGLPEPDEALEAAARRETEEETGIQVAGPLTPLGSIDYKKSRKTVHAFAAPLPEGAVPRCASWEIDQARLMPLDEARRLIHPDQAPFLDRLAAG